MSDLGTPTDNGGMGVFGRTAIGALVVSAVALVGIAGKEAYRGNAYKDSVGVPTVGYGTTEGVKMGDTITPERALIRLYADADKQAKAVRKCIKAPLFQYEFDAYLSLAYNIGAGAFCGSSIPGLVNAGQYADACKRILQFDKARNPNNGKLEPLRGLTNRRQAEYATCIGQGMEPGQ